jgi:prepilin-type N-terminal cleavage/methylation domain-containing protein
MMTKKHHNQVSSSSRGFTLIELLLVLTIIGLMMAIIVPRAMRAQTDSKFSMVRQYGSEMAGYIMTWAEAQTRAQRERMNFTLKDFLYEDIEEDEVGFTSKKLVEKYTGNDDFNGVESMVAPERLPQNPFNEASYFNKANDDTDVPSNKAGLLYLAVRHDPVDQEYLNFYLLYTSTASDEEGNLWFGEMSHEDDDKIRRGVFVTRLYDDQEYGGKEEDLFRWQEKNY